MADSTPGRRGLWMDELDARPELVYKFDFSVCRLLRARARGGDDGPRPQRLHLADASDIDSFLIMTGKVVDPGDGFGNHQQSPATPDQVGCKSLMSVC